jgi:polyisoprenoid-binding protein YceI
MATPTRPRRRRRLRWILGGVGFVVVLSVAAVVAYVELQPTPAPLALPATAARPVGPLDGTWQPAAGSVAGFRIQQTVIGLKSDVVGRTADIVGDVTIAGGELTAAHLRINLLALKSNGEKPAPQFADSLDTQHYPDATVVLAGPVSLSTAFTSGAVATAGATGQLTLHGVTRTVTVTLSARRDGATIEVAGSFPVALADWSITQPAGYGVLGSLADHGVAEFLLVLHRV